MTEKLDQIVEKFNKIEAELLDPAVVSDPAKYRELMKERKRRRYSPPAITICTSLRRRSLRKRTKT